MGDAKVKEFNVARDARAAAIGTAAGAIERGQAISAEGRHLNIPGADADMLDQPFTGCKVALFLGERLVTILRDDKPDIPWPNMWDLPGGGREDGETPMETARREVKEEIGLDVPEAAFVWQRLYPSENRPGKMVWFFVALGPAEWEQDIVFGDEGQRWALVTPDDFAKLEDVIPAYAERLTDWFAQK